MKAAVVTDDLQTVSAHFGMARHYLVYDIEGGVVKGKETRDKVAHGSESITTRMRPRSRACTIPCSPTSMTATR